ncbi:hypothetical protein SDC9_121115 [bioreactor metagenome]|uniref:Uncharacterized protein n=1 Tax=bioreactor metagenome TaxID=1076179 RepID=A0A645CB32_9ZZZZ
MDAFEVGVFRRVARFHKRFEPCQHEFRHAAAEHGLFAEEVGFRLFAERGFEDARARGADACGIRQSGFLRPATCVLLDGDEAGNARAALVFAADGVTGAFRRDHDHVHIRRRHDLAEMDVEAVRKGERVAFRKAF